MAKRDAIASAAIQASAGRSIGVRTHRAGGAPGILEPLGSCQTSSVKAAQRTSAIDIGATVHGSAAARRRNENADTLVSASTTVQNLAVGGHGQLRRALPRERAGMREPA